MANREALHKTLLAVRERIEGARERNQSIGEINTRVALIEPVLSALGWDLHSIDEVYREYRRKPQDNPVDYALFLLRTPRLLIEAKSLDLDLNDRKWVAQTLNYATIVGVEWCVLTNGDEYRLYNSHATVDVDEKLFRSIRITDPDATDLTLGTLELLSKDKLGENLISVLWKSHFVDRRLKAVLKDIFQDADPGFIRLIRKRLDDLQPSDIRDSIKRADLRISFPSALPPTEPQKPVPARERRTSKGERSPGQAEVRATDSTVAPKPDHAPAPKMLGVEVADLIGAGLILPPLPLFKVYKKTRLTATLLPDGGVEFDGRRYDSLSTAAGMARASVVGIPKGRKYPQTNGWTFWKYADPGTGEVLEIDHLRQRYLRQQGPA